MTIHWVGLPWPAAMHRIEHDERLPWQGGARLVLHGRPDNPEEGASWAVSVLAPPAESNPLMWLERWCRCAPPGPMICVLAPGLETIGPVLVRRGATDYVLRVEGGEEALLASVAKAEARYLGEDAAAARRLLELMVDGTMVVQGDGTVREANTGAEHLLGAERGELLGERLPWVPHAGCSREVIVLGGRSSSTVLEVAAVDAVEHDEDVVLVSLRDVSAARRADLALRDAERKYRGIFENAVEGLFQVSPAGEFLVANPAVARIFGYDSPDALLGGVTEAGQRLVAAVAERTPLGDADALHDRVLPFEAPARQVDGRDLWVSGSARPVFDNNGELVWLEGVLEDISERKEATLALADRLRFEQVVANISTRVVNLGRDGLERLLDDTLAAVAAYVGADRSHAVVFGDDGRLAESVHAWRSPAVPAPIVDLSNLPPGAFPYFRSYLRRGEMLILTSVEELPASAEEEQAFVREVRLGALVMMPLVCAGTVLGLLAVSTVDRPCLWTSDDIALLRMVSEILSGALYRRRGEAERDRLEAQIRHAQKLESLGVLAGGIAHDFNNLLVGILGHAGLALAEMRPTSGAYDAMRHVQTAAQRAAQLTHQLLAYSGKGRFLSETLDLNAVVVEMQGLLETAVAHRGELAIALHREPAWLVGDPGQVRQVVMNLLTNAADALAATGGLITVRTGCVEATAAEWRGTYLAEDLPDGPYVWVEVADTGPGMDEETQARIFDPFFTTKFTGRGLGLAVVLGIVRSHRGAVRVTSAPGAGTTFRVWFPAAAAAEPAAEAAPLPALPALRGSILIVDDEEAVRQVAQAILVQSGCDVVCAADGAAALSLLAAREFDAVLLDLTMPLMSGDQVHALALRLRPDLRVVVSSGYSEQEATRNFRVGERLGFVQKPYTPAQLVDAVRRVLAEPSAT